MNLNWRIDRRSFLRGTAGALVPLPFLNLMETSAKAAAGTDGKPPLRFISMFKPNGTHPPSWNINGGTEFDYRLSPLMAPFAKHREDLLILDNIGDFGFSSHMNSTRRFLTGHHDNMKSASIDQLIADQICGDTPHRSLELTNDGLFVGQPDCSYISYDKRGDGIPRMRDPQLVFDRLFNNPMDQPKSRQEMISLLDRVRDDTKSLVRKAGYQDQQTLNEYLTVVRETEQRLQNLNRSAASLGADLSTPKRPEAPSNFNEQTNAMLDLIALALWTDSTRCVSYMLGNCNSRRVFDFLGTNQQFHDLSHFFRKFSPTNLKALIKINLWHMEKFDYLLSKLKSYKDENGSLLSHSVVHFGSGFGHSDTHTAMRVPTILAGQGGGLVKTGRYLRYTENKDHSQLHFALLRMFGVKMDAYAASSTALKGLDGGKFDEYRERPFDSWVKHSDGHITAQGRLRMSDNLDEGKIFYLDIKDQPSIRVQVAFNDFHKFNLAYHVGTAIILTGDGRDQGGQLLITKLTELKSLYGNNPGTRNG